MVRLYSVIILLVLSFFSACVTTEYTSEITKEASDLSFDLSKPLPVDPNLVVGKLDNGLTYYIRMNKRPEKRAELRLVVNTGSVLEDQNQRGLAHFVEHMAFKGTEHFPKDELVNYLESIGMLFGPDLNAYTSFDETIYVLQVPTDNPSVVEKALLIMKEWAESINFEDEEIEKERSVVIEEWRLGRGAEARMREKQFPILLKDSRYSERLPIGQKKILESFEYETLRRFYKDWYRPGLMAVVAVGDFDKSWIERLIQKHFSKLSDAKNVRERKIYPVPDHKETLFSIATDPESTRSSVSIFYKHDNAPNSTVNDFRRIIIERLYNAMMNERFHELSLQADPPFISGFSSLSRMIRYKDFYVQYAEVKDNGIKRGLESLIIEANRVRRYGFTQSEFERQKKKLLKSIERLYIEKDKTESNRYTAEYIRNLLYGDPIPGIEYEYMLYKKLIPGIQLEEVNRLTNSLISDHNRVVLVNAPEKPGNEIPTEEDLLAVFDSVKEKDISPYVDTITDQPLLADLPGPSKIVEEKKIKALGITEWTLSNGVRIILKPTDFKNDEFLFTAFSPGGHSLVSDEKYIAAVTAASLIREGGIGNFNKIDLQKILAGKIVSVVPYIGELHEGISGGASPKDMETMFHLIYLYFTSPRKDNTAFLSYQSRKRGFIENRNARPETVFEDTVHTTMSQNHHRRRPWSLKMLDEMDLQASFEIYRDRFADAGDFTFLFIGNFDLSEIKPLIQTYLGGLPSLNRNEKWKDVGIKPPKGFIKKVIRKGIEPKSRAKITFTGPFNWKRQQRYDIQSMTRLLQMKLRVALREDLGGTYSVGVWSSISHYPDKKYSITISFGSAPERLEELIDTVFHEIENLKNYGAASSYLTKVKESQRRRRETDLKNNRFWLSTLRFYYLHEEEPLNILKYNKLVEKLSSEAIQYAAQKYFDTKNHVIVVLLPE
jgi:zinc protease